MPTTAVETIPSQFVWCSKRNCRVPKAICETQVNKPKSDCPLSCDNRPGGAIVSASAKSRKAGRQGKAA